MKHTLYYRTAPPSANVDIQLYKAAAIMEGSPLARLAPELRNRTYELALHLGEPVDIVQI